MKLVTTINCKYGDILAEDVSSDRGVIIAIKDTIINDYVKLKLIDHNIYEVKIYESMKDKKAYTKFERQYKECIVLMKNLVRSVTIGVEEDIEKVTLYMTEKIYNNISESDYIIHCLHSIRYTDEYTHTHCINTAFYSMLMGNWLNLPKHQICELISASLIHDLGKTKIPLEILNKKGKLDDNEFEIIKRHPVLGYEIIEKFPGLSKEIKQAVLLHHERMDGSGYPYGLKGNEICLYTKIISIADVYDAMTQNRIYKNKVSPFESFKMFMSDGFRLFDYPILYEFLKHMAPMYVGNKVQLSNGAIGEIVYIPPQDITSPILCIDLEYMDLSRSNDIKVLQVI